MKRLTKLLHAPAVTCRITSPTLLLYTDPVSELSVAVHSLQIHLQNVKSNGGKIVSRKFRRYVLQHVILLLQNSRSFYTYTYNRVER